MQVSSEDFVCEDDPCVVLKSCIELQNENKNTSLFSTCKTIRLGDSFAAPELVISFQSEFGAAVGGGVFVM